MPFQPEVKQQLAIEGASYKIAEHPSAPGIPYGQEGRQATVYQLAAESDRRALKVFKPRYRVPALVSLVGRLAAFADLPGLQVCRRTVLTPQHHGALLRQQPDLIYAVLMPWVEGPTWMEVLLGKRQLSPEQCLALARALAEILSLVEQRGVAHCDVSGANVLLPGLATGPEQRGRGMVALVDVEQLYGPGLERPALLPGGSPGYAHTTAPEGLWGPDADRFAGAVLLAEMLGWCDERVRQAAWGENYFEPPEMQQESTHSRTLVQVLRERWGEGVAGLLERAWQSSALADCATFGEWLMLLPEGVPTIRPIAAVAPSAPAADADATVQALVEAAHSLEQQGNLTGALEVYRRAQSLIAPGSGYAQELALVMGGLEKKLRTPTPVPPCAAREAAGATGPDVDRLFDEGVAAYEGKEWAWAKELLSEVIRQQPHYRRNGQQATELLAEVESRRATPARPARGWGRTVGLLALLFLGSIGILWLIGQQGRGPLAVLQVTRTPQPTFTPRPTPTLTPTPIPLQLDNAGQAQELYGIGTHSSWGAAVAFSPDGRLLASAAWDTTVKVWRVSDRTLLFTLDHSGQVDGVSFSPDGKLVASCGCSAYNLLECPGGTISVWSVEDGGLVQAWQTQYMVSDIVFSPDGQTLASGSDDNNVYLWRASDGALLRTLRGHKDDVTSIAFSPNSQALATGSNDGTVRLWRVSDGTLLSTLDEYTQVTDVAFSTGGSFLAAVGRSGEEGMLMLWDTQNWERRFSQAGHTWSAGAVAFSPDDTLIAAGGGHLDKTIRLWQVSNGEPLATLTGHTEWVAALVFSPDGSLIASTSGDGTVRLWGVK